MYLEMEEREEIFKMFKGKEADTTVYIGQINERFEEGIRMSAVASIRFLGYDDDTIIRYVEPVGYRYLAEDLSEEERKKAVEGLEKETEAFKQNWINIFLGKGFTVYCGVWMK